MYRFASLFAFDDAIHYSAILLCISFVFSSRVSIFFLKALIDTFSASLLSFRNKRTGSFKGSNLFFFLSSEFPMFCTCERIAFKFFSCSFSWWLLRFAILFLPRLWPRSTKVRGSTDPTSDWMLVHRRKVSRYSRHYGSVFNFGLGGREVVGLFGFSYGF